MKNPINVLFSQSSRRNHAFKCLKSGNLEIFSQSKKIFNENIQRQSDPAWYILHLSTDKKNLKKQKKKINNKTIKET